MIEVKNISKSYGTIQALSDISLTINRGEIVALLGVNGAGKSTLMKILTGIIQPDKGSVSIFGKDIRKENLAVKRETGYLSEDNPLYDDMYVLEYLNYVADIYKVKRDAIATLIPQVGLDKETGKKIQTLSRGNRQRVGIAQSLIHNPSFLILDEPTSGLDPNQRDSLNRLFTDISRDKIILFSSHILQDVKDICTRFVLIDKGVVVADKKIEEIETVEDFFHQITNEDNSR